VPATSKKSLKYGHGTRVSFCYNPGSSLGIQSKWGVVGGVLRVIQTRRLELNMPLSDAKIRNAKPKERPYKLFDGNGMFLLVMPSGSKLWKIKYRYQHKEKEYAVGAYPLIGAAEAREI